MKKRSRIEATMNNYEEENRRENRGQTAITGNTSLTPIVIVFANIRNNCDRPPVFAAVQTPSPDMLE